MLEKELIQYRGFRNTYDENGNCDGFEFRYRLSYYRGAWLSQLRLGRVIVDGEPYYPDSGLVTWVIQGKEYTPAEMEKDNKGFWPMTEPATIRIKKPGGLAQGYHEIEVHSYVSHSYMPPSMDEYVDSDDAPIIGNGIIPKRRMLIV